MRGAFVSYRAYRIEDALLGDQLTRVGVGVGICGRQSGNLAAGQPAARTGRSSAVGAGPHAMRSRRAAQYFNWLLTCPPTVWSASPRPSSIAGGASCVMARKRA